MAEMFALEPDVEKRVHPHALKRLKEWKADIIREVPHIERASMDELNTDVNKYLSDEEKIKFRKSQNKIEDWLKKCFDIGSGYSDYPYTTYIIDPMIEMKRLFKRAYKLKDYERKRIAVLEALSPPISDAKVYLDADDYLKFEESIPGAIDAYLEHKKENNTDGRSFKYRYLCRTINDRKEQEELLKAADSKARDFSRSLRKEIGKIESLLHPDKQNIKEYFSEHVSDPRYLGYNFSDLLTEEQKHDPITRIREIIDDKLEKLISADLKDYICWKHMVYMFLLPSASYSCDIVPSMDFYFDAYSIIKVEVYVKPGHKAFGEYIYPICQIEKNESDADNSSFTVLKDPEFIGYAYYCLTPNDLDRIFWQVIPLSLVVGLMDDETEPAGSTIIEASDDELVYKIKNHKRDICISSSFVNYLKQIGGIDEMSAIGIISNKVAHIIKRKLDQLAAEEKASLLIMEQNTARIETTGKTTKKAMAYRLFKKGKLPSSPEVKALGMHKSTRYKYYRQWEADDKP